MYSVEHVNVLYVCSDPLFSILQIHLWQELDITMITYKNNVKKKKEIAKLCKPDVDIV